ncbi:acidic mammalian chitinase-like, partial [Limulus polyphemus]|uniref:Acidic mammalian chitinase-like n=1 Tax=Limulus polyphemus TaxID=6850 RepID=A0ABM1TP36_LIMPO
DLKEAFAGEAKFSQKPQLLLSASVPGNVEAIAVGYDVKELNKHLDMFNVMTYDFHGDWERQVGHNSPLYPLEGASVYDSKLTVDYSASEWVKKGASKEKMCIGIPTYGRTYILKNDSWTDVGAPAVGGGEPGNYTGEPGFMAFFEVCDFLKSGATLVWDDEQMVPYAYKGNQWVGFDDMRSVRSKVNAKKVDCKDADGVISYHQDKQDCSKYYLCHGRRRHHMPCPPNLVFNPDENLCDWPENVDSCLLTSSENSIVV